MRDFRFAIADLRLKDAIDARENARAHSNCKSQIANRKSRRGFSLTEILIVIAIIVLLLALALPAFNFISGGRSVDGAMNGISAFLARARTEAVGLQEMRGVMFYIDPKSESEMMVLVKEVPAPTS